MQGHVHSTTGTMKKGLSKGKGFSVFATIMLRSHVSASVLLPLLVIHFSKKVLREQFCPSILHLQVESKVISLYTGIARDADIQTGHLNGSD